MAAYLIFAFSSGSVHGRQTIRAVSSPQSIATSQFFHDFEERAFISSNYSPGWLCHGLPLWATCIYAFAKRSKRTTVENGDPMLQHHLNNTLTGTAIHLLTSAIVSPMARVLQLQCSTTHALGICLFSDSAPQSFTRLDIRQSHKFSTSYMRLARADYRGNEALTKRGIVQFCAVGEGGAHMHNQCVCGCSCVYVRDRTTRMCGMSILGRQRPVCDATVQIVASSPKFIEQYVAFRCRACKSASFSKYYAHS